MHFQVHHGSAEKSLLLFIMYSVVNADDEKFNWITAERTCQTYDANLASVHNKLENDLLLSLVPSSTRFWVGAQDGEQVSLLTLSLKQDLEWANMRWPRQFNLRKRMQIEKAPAN
uniref:C-type lectin domain-containing protein n=1 Tax=Sinocyclocheilus rhinocerous TaxID=307959 RepID=A0A673G335_9TELE